MVHRLVKARPRNESGLPQHPLRLLVWSAIRKTAGDNVPRGALLRRLPDGQEAKRYVVNTVAEEEEEEEGSVGKEAPGRNKGKPTEACNVKGRECPATPFSEHTTTDKHVSQLSQIWANVY